MKYKVMIVEDQTMPRELFELRIQTSEHFELALSIDNAALADVYCLRFPVDLILMDVVTRDGESGLDGVELPVPTRPLEQKHAVNYIVETIMASEPGTITLVPTGPLTNIAMAVRMEPRIVERVKEVVLMGGGYHVGNWSAVAEFNIKVDPEAAHIVFNEKWPLTMVGLDLTHQALCTPAAQKRIEEVGTPLATFVSGLMDFFRKTYQDNQDFVDPPVHDPCTVAYLIDPTCVETRRCPLDVEIHSELTLGMTVADLRGPEPSAEECHTQVATKLDFDKFWNLVTDAIERIG